MAPKGPKIDKTSVKYLDLLLKFGIDAEDLPDDLKGKSVHIPQVNFDVPIEQQVRAKSGPPPYAVRAKTVEDLTEKLHQALRAQWKELAENETDGKRFERVWKAVIETLELDRLNDLIKEHNTFYPIEANLKEHPDTGKLMIGNTPWKPKKKFTPEYLLDMYPPDLEKAKEAADAEEE